MIRNQWLQITTPNARNTFLVAWKSADPNGNAWSATPCTGLVLMWWRILRSNICKMNMPTHANTAPEPLNLSMLFVCTPVLCIKARPKWPRFLADIKPTVFFGTDHVESLNEEHRRRVDKLIVKQTYGHDSRLWECSQCGFAESAKQKVFSHVENTHMDQFANICQYCFKPQANFQAMKMHISRKHREEHRLSKLKNAASKWSSLCCLDTVAEINEVHRQRVQLMMYRDPETRYWTCSTCGFHGLDKNRLFTHIESKHICEKTANFCQYCFKPQASYNALKIHIFRNHREEHKQKRNKYM